MGQGAGRRRGFSLSRSTRRQASSQVCSLYPPLLLLPFLHTHTPHPLDRSFLLLTATHIYILREARKKGWGQVVAKRPLEMIVRITSKKKVPEIITFKYGETNENSDSGPNIIATDCLVFEKPYEVTRLVKQQVIKVLDGAASDSPAAS